MSRIAGMNRFDSAGRIACDPILLKIANLNVYNFVNLYTIYSAKAGLYRNSGGKGPATKTDALIKCSTIGPSPDKTVTTLYFFCKCCTKLRLSIGAPVREASWLAISTVSRDGSNFADPSRKLNFGKFPTCISKPSALEVCSVCFPYFRK